MAVLPTGNRITIGRPNATDPVASIMYDNLDRPYIITYNIQGGRTEVVTVTYSGSGHPIVGEEYKNHILDIPQAMLVPISPAELAAACAARTTAELKAIETLGGTVANIVTLNDDANLVVTNSGELIFTPTIA